MCCSQQAGHGSSLHSGKRGRLPVIGRIDIRLAHQLPGELAEEHIPHSPSSKLSGSVQFSRSLLSDSLQLHGLLHTRLPCPSPTPRACSNSCPFEHLLCSLYRGKFWYIMMNVYDICSMNAHLFIHPTHSYCSALGTHNLLY